MMLRRFFLLFLFIGCTSLRILAQVDEHPIPDVDYGNPRTYTIGGITVSGVQYLNSSVLVSLSGLQVGEKVEIPGEKIRAAMDKLWKQGLFEDVAILISGVQNDLVFLDIQLVERPRLSKYVFTGIRKGEGDGLKDKMKINKGDVITDNLLNRVRNTIIKHYMGKGFFSTEVKMKQVKDTSSQNTVTLYIDVKKNQRVKIEKINIIGNDKMSDMTLKSALKKTKEVGIYRPLNAIKEALIGAFDYTFKNKLKNYPDYLQRVADNNLKLRIFKGSKFVEKDYEEDKDKLIKKFYNNGYRDASLLKDSVYLVGPNRLNIDLTVNEGHKYYYRNITFVGNTKFTSQELGALLGIRKGDVYNEEQLNTALQFNQNGVDLMSLFVDDGYLTCSIEPIEQAVENDSIDLQIRIREGKQMTINRVTVSGNTKTSDRVIYRELYSRPGQLFSRSDLLRSRTSLSQLKYFDAEKIDMQPVNIDPNNGTVDIAYKLEETSSDQFELSGGWGYNRLIGTVGISFNNFSARNFFKKDAWQPVPSGDGQKLSLRLQSWGKGYFSGSASFVEPWLGGKKPNQFSVSGYHSVFNNSQYYSKTSPSYYSYKITGLNIGLSKRLQWPDNYFNLSQGLNLQLYNLDNYSNLGGNIKDGIYQSYSYTLGLTRTSIDAPIFARSGSEVNVSVEASLPYSLLFPKWFKGLKEGDKGRLVEFHQWKLNATFYQQIIGDLVLMARTKIGILGNYSNKLEVTGFNRYFMGGDGMSGTGMSSGIDGRQMIGFRGYSNESLTPSAYQGGTVFNKSTLELRYPLSLNPSSTIFGLVFLEAGNNWLKFKQFNPFDVRRSAGVGVRVFLPMFGLLGLDWGYGFDAIPGKPDANKGQFHFSINSSID